MLTAESAIREMQKLVSQVTTIYTIIILSKINALKWTNRTKMLIHFVDLNLDEIKTRLTKYEIHKMYI